jgi:exodeoxyribonuclease VII large subunit
MKPQESLFQYIFDDAERRPMTVSELNAEVRAALEREFASVWVEGEVVNFVRAGSGHWYFNLNDGESQIRCVCWKGTNYRIRFQPENGITVRVRGRLTLYEKRGEFQLVVDSLEPSGEGALRAAFEQIKGKLESEGLFADEIKRPIPFFPRRVGVVTSKSGAAFHDILHMLTRRARSVGIVLAPALVQGEAAADSIRQAIIALNQFNLTLEPMHRIDVLIVGRGGGSAEDLWAFNDETLARAIRASEIPVISAVGHEIDWTISDLVADLRASTPSAAAELVAAREEDILNTLQTRQGRLVDLMEMQCSAADTRLDNTISQLQTSFSGAVQAANARFSDVAARLTPSMLKAKAAEAGSVLAMLDQRRGTAADRYFKAKDEHLNVQMAKLNALSPLAVLTRGYSITQAEDGRVLRDASSTKPGDKLKIRLDHGKLNAEVLSSEDT